MYGIYKKEVLMSRSKKEMDLTVGDPFRSLLKFAIPVILGNLFQLFYTLADTMIVGKTLGAQSLAAVGSTSIIIYFVFCFINGFTGGFGICLGQRCGAKDEAGMRKSVAVSTLLSIAFTVFLTLICCLLAHQILIWMQIPPISQEKLMTTCSSSFSARCNGLLQPDLQHAPGSGRQ